MTNIHYISACGRIAAMFLLALAVIGICAAPAQATTGCDTQCNSPLANEIHTLPQGVLTPPCPPPIPDFCACPRAGCDSLLVSFTDYSQGYIYTWEWDFGDPASGSDNFSNEENPTHWYKAAGNYTVTLTVTGPGGTATKTRSDFITVKASPKADFTSTTEEGCTSTTVYFKDLSTGGPNWWRWDFGDGVRVYEQNPSHTYAAPGTYAVKLKVMNDCGRDSVTKEITITVGTAPTAAFTSDITSGCTGSTVTFTDQSLLADSWLWNFGDGTTSTEHSIPHTSIHPPACTQSL
jgi:PKD repeat protein